MEKFSAPSSFGSDFSERSNNAVINGFIDQNICGEGASCIVYKMRLGGLQVAVKRLRREYRTNPVFVASYRKEYQIGQRLKHDALPVYRDFHEDSDEVYIVLDYVDGISIQDFILTEDGKGYFRSEENVRRFFIQLISAIAYIHRSGVIHCDIKPANIMLRHSDRSVMLLDLDKSYSDTLDRTHGGTPDISDPLTLGNKPTTQKDYAAVGRLLEIFIENVPDFPKSKFRRFHKLCSQEDVNPETLIDAIKTRSNFKYWIAGVVVCLLALLAILWRWFDVSGVTDKRIESSDSVKDTIVVVNHIQDAPVSVENIHTEIKSNKSKTFSVTVEDFDMKMSDLAQKLDESMKSLRSGNIPNHAIQELITGAVDKYTTIYGKILSDYQDITPDIPSLDVELALAHASEQSKVSRLFQQFTQEAVDTLRKRNPEFYNE